MIKSEKLSVFEKNANLAKLTYNIKNGVYDDDIYKEVMKKDYFKNVNKREIGID